MRSTGVTEETSARETKEQTDFLNACMETKPMQYCFKYLVAKVRTHLRGTRPPPLHSAVHLRRRRSGTLMNGDPGRAATPAGHPWPHQSCVRLPFRPGVWQHVQRRRRRVRGSRGHR